jgi:hypothetical protein
MAGTSNHFSSGVSQVHDNLRIHDADPKFRMAEACFPGVSNECGVRRSRIFPGLASEKETMPASIVNSTSWSSGLDETDTIILTISDMKLMPLNDQYAVRGYATAVGLPHIQKEVE